VKRLIIVKECLSILVPAVILGLASTILAYPELLPAFLEWVAQAILYVVIGAIVLLTFGYVAIRLNKNA
jgi:hypothetical protein